MAEVLLFHHAQGLTPGVRAFADELRAAGHTVHTPDLFDGRTFDSIDEGVAHAKEIGFENVLERGVRSADAGTHLSRWRYFYQRHIDRAVSSVRSAGTRKARLRGGPQSHAGDAVRRARRHSKACKRSGGHQA